MSEPTSVYSFYGLILRVAREAGIAEYGSTGSGKTLIPVDAEQLQTVKRVVNDGIKMFMEMSVKPKFRPPVNFVVGGMVTHSTRLVFSRSEAI